MISVCGEAMQALEQKACGADTELFLKTHIAREMSMFLLEPVDRANYSRRSKLTDKIISTLNRMRSYERTKLRKLAQRKLPQTGRNIDKTYLLAIKSFYQQENETLESLAIRLMKELGYDKKTASYLNCSLSESMNLSRKKYYLAREKQLITAFKEGFSSWENYKSYAFDPSAEFSDYLSRNHRGLFWKMMKRPSTSRKALTDEIGLFLMNY